MPEGDTIAKLAAAMAPDLVGQSIAIRSRDPHIDNCPDGTVHRVVAHGKHLLIELDNGYTLRTHLGMRGSWHRFEPGSNRPEGWISVELHTARHHFACMAAREIEVVRSRGVRRRMLEERLGPDVIREPDAAAGAPARARRLLAPGTPVVDVVLHQGVAAGIGNVYKSELLFLTRLHPKTPLAHVPDAVIAELYGEAARLLKRNARTNGTRRTRRSKDAERAAGALWVYGRGGKPCLHCGTPVCSAHLGHRPRVTYWCPRCQNRA